MATQLSEITTRVTDILIDTGAKAVARVNPEIRKAQKDAEDRYRFGAMRSQIDPNPTVSAGSRDVAALPDSWLEPRGAPFRLVGGSGVDALDEDLPPLEWIEEGFELVKMHPTDPSNATGQGEPKFLSVLDEAATEIQVWPPADATYTFVIRYWKRLQTLTNPTHTNWFVTDAEDYLTFRAAARVLFFNRDHDEALRYETLAEGTFRRLVREDKKKRRKSARNLVPRRDAGGTLKQVRM